MVIQNLNTGWRMKRADTEDFFPAVVPGTVYTDLLRNGQMKDPFEKDYELEALKRMDYDYEYVAEVTPDEKVKAAKHALLRFEGVDTIADIYWNGTLLSSVANMHRIFEFEVTGDLRDKNELRVLFHSPTKFIAEAYRKAPTHGSEDAMEGFVHIRKAHCMFGWDWGAHLPDAGLYRPVKLLGIQNARIDGVYVHQKHEGGKVELNLEIEEKNYEEKKDLRREVRVLAPDGTLLLTTDKAEGLLIEKPELWWPNGYGKQPLYTVEVTLLSDEGVEDVWTHRIGLRTMTMSREKDEWGEKFACCVNGTDIFAMGADYIPEDHLLGRVTPETTRALLEKGIFANFNSIRVWGGGYYPSDWFFDICDELGLVVWEDCMFACGVYDLTPEFEANVRAEFADNFKRIRNHASLGLVSGNNEMEQFVKLGNWVTKQSEVRDYILLYERVIPEMMQKYMRDTFYWPSSPSSGGSFDEPQDPNRGDVHYWEVWHGNKPFSDYRNHYFRYLSEFGFQSFPCMKTIETISKDPEDHNIFSYIMERHQRNGNANGKIMNYMQMTYRYPSKFETVLYASQLLQADAIRYGVEHFRRNRGRCMGTVYWQFNDCWPVASWSSVDYTGRLKALHYAARRFFAPVMISCNEEGLMTSGHDLVRLPFDFEKSIHLNVANETMEEKTVTVRWTLRTPDAKILRKEEKTVKVPALSSVWLDKVMLPDVDIYGEYVAYEALIDGEVVSEGTVNFSYPKYFRYEDPRLATKVIGDEIEVSAEAYAKSVEIQNENEDLVLSDNYFDMNGGKKRVKILSGKPEGIKLRSVYDIR